VASSSAAPTEAGSVTVVTAIVSALEVYPMATIPKKLLIIPWLSIETIEADSRAR
jgi:hypothetical protein